MTYPASEWVPAEERLSAALTRIAELEALNAALSSKVAELEAGAVTPASAARIDRTRRSGRGGQ